MQQKAHARTILFLSNGYGEDTVGARIAQSVQALAGSRLRPVAFPIVGAGDPYRLVGIPVIGPRAHLPSGGFGYLNIRNAVKDRVGPRSLDSYSLIGVGVTVFLRIAS